MGTGMWSAIKKKRKDYLKNKEKYNEKQRRYCSKNKYKLTETARKKRQERMKRLKKWL